MPTCFYVLFLLYFIFYYIWDSIMIRTLNDAPHLCTMDKAEILTIFSPKAIVKLSAQQAWNDEEII